MTSKTNVPVLGFKDVTIMAVVANFGIRWIPVAAGLGASAILFWILGALIFFMPLSIIAAKLSKKYPDQGGLYAWTKRALGDTAGFMVAWLYWINTIFYYPAVLIFLATNFAYFIGKPELANNHLYITCTVLIAFWLITIISFYGIRANKYLVDIGGVIGSFIPALAIIILGVSYYFISGHSATTYSWHALLPQSSITHNLSTLTIIMFAMAGIEVIPTFANSVKNPRKNLFWGLIVASIILFGLYILGTIALNILSQPADIQKASGLLQAFSIIDQRYHIEWFTKLMAFLLTFAEFAAVSIWLLAPVIMFFQCTPKGILPDWLHRQNKYEAPQNALIFMGILVSIIIILTNFITSINAMYQALILMATILYFIPYLYLVFAYNKLERNNLFITRLLATLVFTSTLLGIIFSFQPPDLHTTTQIIVYEAEVIIGPIIFIVIGWLLYKFKSSNLKPL